MSSLHDYENLCSLNCLDIEEKNEKNDKIINGKLLDVEILRTPWWNQPYQERKSSSIT